MLSAPAPGERFDPRALDLVHEVGGPELVRELVATFAAHVARQVEVVETAAASGDTAAVAEVAHSLKSSAAQMGARALSALCLRLERSAGEGSSAELEALTAELPAEVAQAVAWLRERAGPSAGEG